MSYSVIRLQDEFLFNIPANGTLEQPRSLAVNVAPYQFVTPFIRIKTDPANALTASAVTFKFWTAAVMIGPDEASPIGATGVSSLVSPSTGERFVYLGAATDIQITQGFSTASQAGNTFTYIPLATPPSTNLGLPTIQNPGGLMLWKAQNSNISAQIFVADIYLVCRGPG